MKMSTLNQQLFLKSDPSYDIGLCIEAFLVDKIAIGSKPRTVKNYSQKLRSFMDYCDHLLIKSIFDITPDAIRHYLILLQDDHNTGGVHGFYRPLKTFLFWCETEYDLDWKNPIRKVKLPNPPAIPLEPVTPAQVQRLVELCGTSYTGSRDKAIFLTLFDTGLRAFELCAMDLRHFNPIDGSILIPHAKQNKFRTVFVSKKTRRFLRAYLKYRNPHDPAIWQTIEGTRLTYWGLRQILLRRSEIAGISGVTLHDFRRAFCLQCLRNGMDIYTLQRLSGISNLKVLRGYLAQVTRDLQISHAAHNPVDTL